MKTRLLCMPTLCADIFDATGEILPGGEALNLACIACRYDHMDVALLGAIGEDGPGQAILREIDARPIDRTNVHVILGGATATHRIYHTPEGPILQAGFLAGRRIRQLPPDGGRQGRDECR